MAIAFGALTQDAGGGSGLTSLSWTGPTVSGSDTIGFVRVYIEGTGAADNLTGITWNGSSMTLAAKKIRGNNIGWEYLYYIYAPGSASTVTVSVSPASYIDGGMAAYYTGAKQSGGMNVTNSASAVGNSLDVSVTTTVDNCWVVGSGISDNGGIGAGTGMTSRGTQSGVWIFGDSNGPKTPAGSYTIGLVGTGNGNEVIIAAAFEPVAAAGPTNLKSLDGNVKANIKSYNGNVIANIKSISGNS